MNLTTFGAMLCSAPSFSLDTFCARACSLGNVHLRAWSAFYTMTSCLPFCSEIRSTLGPQVTSWVLCSGLLTWWLIHFRSFHDTSRRQFQKNNNTPFSEGRVSRPMISLYLNGATDTKVSLTTCTEDHNQVQRQPSHPPVKHLMSVAPKDLSPAEIARWTYIYN